MDLIDLIMKQGEEISNLYDTLDKVIEMFDEMQQENKVLANTLIHNNNNNIVTINERLNYMDLEIECNNKAQFQRKELLTHQVNIQLITERKKNGLYKTDIVKRLSRLRRENKDDVDKKLKLLKVDVEKNNKNKEIIETITKNKNEIEVLQFKHVEFKKVTEKNLQALKNEIKIRTREKNKNIKGINVI